MSKNTAAFFVQAAVAFGISLLSVLGGILFLPLDAATVPRHHRAVSGLQRVHLAKVIRDQQEAATVRVRLDEARMEKLLAEHNPFTAVS